ncbi:MAG: alpha/beta fold hydrolase [Pseudomonadaceae bacterium]|nr:alpha/beta fold hydrolase [Pseudomonadaceae bacterium]
MGKWVLVLIVLLLAVLLPYLLADINKTRLSDAVRATLPGDFVRLSDGYVRYRASGPEDGQPVILVHGFSYAGWMYDDIEPALAAAGLRVIVIDSFGRGYSDRPDSDHTPALYNRQFDDLLDALDITKPVDLVGNSMGGAMVVDYAAHSPQRVRRVVAMVPAGLSLTSGSVPGIVGVPIIGDWFFHVFARKGIVEGGGLTTDDADLKARIDEAMADQARYSGYYSALLSTLRHYPMADQLDRYRALAATGKPLLGIFGERDKLIPVSAAKTLAEVVPEAEVAVLAGEYHDVALEKPAVIAALLKEFLLRP